MQFLPGIAAVEDAEAYRQALAQLQQYSDFTQPQLAAFLLSVDALPRGEKADPEQHPFRRAEVQLLEGVTKASAAASLAHKVWLLQAVTAVWQNSGKRHRFALVDVTSAAVLAVRDYIYGVIYGFLHVPVR